MKRGRARGVWRVAREKKERRRGGGRRRIGTCPAMLGKWRRVQSREQVPWCDDDSAEQTVCASYELTEERERKQLWVLTNREIC